MPEAARDQGDSRERRQAREIWSPSSRLPHRIATTVRSLSPLDTVSHRSEKARDQGRLRDADDSSSVIVKKQQGRRERRLGKMTGL
ncbi:hypothetical protein PRIPAC_76171 [Pristionchus pacificus]|uniref:Uncharacterized protein n=1 Tax=Pristionchus pacificus TaxID=54126 RepID=A0A2A6C5E2_PRIPA|nr:hypothetical protein PRIPAC_76171 [Pristionchus pacificus]|eukprot:PDM73395.1 hypothetical protein PRIPAC_40751 [Pristionchus pacificus]